MIKILIRGWKGGRIHVPIYLKFLNFIFTFIFYIVSKREDGLRANSLSNMYILMIKKNVCCDKKWGEQLLSDPPNVTCLTQRGGCLPKQ